MGWAGAIQAGTTVLGGILGSNGANNAQEAQTRASEAQIAEQRRQYDQSRTDQQPFMGYGTGQGGLAGLSQLDSGNLSGFWNSPDNKAQREAFQYSSDHGAAARGRLFSGGYQMDAAAGQGNLAAQQLGNYRGSLQWGANLGQNAASGLGQLGQQSANQIGSAYGQMGQAQANGAYDRANTWGSALNGLSGIAGSYFGSR